MAGLSHLQKIFAQRVEGLTTIAGLSGLVILMQAHHIAVVSSLKGLKIIARQFFYQCPVPMGQMTKNTAPKTSPVREAILVA